MIQSSKIDVYLEIGKKKTFASAVDWPGWCRSGRDEATALQTLFEYGPRYAGALHGAGIEFQVPIAATGFVVVERLEGNATTDFGAPGLVPSADTRPLENAELRRFQALLQAYWLAFDETVRAASGKELRKGPRGGGRDLEGIVRHVLGADASYLARLAWKFKKDEARDLSEELNRTRQVVLEALAAAARGETPAQGPRGGRGLAAALLRPPRGLARAGSPLGDRGPRHMTQW